MKRFTLVMILLLTLALMLAPTASAKLKPAIHKGFFIGLGGGGGSLKLDLDNFSGKANSESGLAGNFYLGFALNQTILIGIESDAWTKEFKKSLYGSTATFTFSNAAVCLWFYPSPYFWIKGGPAIANANLEIAVSGLNVSGSESGTGVTLGAGGELRLTRKFAIVPAAHFIYQSFDGFSTTIFSITIGVGWYW